MINDFYTESIILYDYSASTGGYWSTSTDGDYSSASVIPAAVNLLSGGERFEYDKIGFDAQYKAYSAVSTEVYAGRRCKWNGRYFEIVEIPKNTLQKNHHLKFLLKDVGDA